MTNIQRTFLATACFLVGATGEEIEVFGGCTAKFIVLTDGIPKDTLKIYVAGLGMEKTNERK